VCAGVDGEPGSIGFSSGAHSRGAYLLILLFHRSCQARYLTPLLKFTSDGAFATPETFNLKVGQPDIALRIYWL
jgi:hypothetical protein